MPDSNDHHIKLLAQICLQQIFPHQGLGRHDFYNFYVGVDINVIHGIIRYQVHHRAFCHIALRKDNLGRAQSPGHFCMAFVNRLDHDFRHLPFFAKHSSHQTGLQIFRGDDNRIKAANSHLVHGPGVTHIKTDHL